MPPAVLILDRAGSVVTRSHVALCAFPAPYSDWKISIGCGHNNLSQALVGNLPAFSTQGKRCLWKGCAQLDVAMLFQRLLGVSKITGLGYFSASNTGSVSSEQQSSNRPICFSAALTLSVLLVPFSNFTMWTYIFLTTCIISGGVMCDGLIPSRYYYTKMPVTFPSSLLCSIFLDCPSIHQFPGLSWRNNRVSVFRRAFGHYVVVALPRLSSASNAEPDQYCQAGVQILSRDLQAAWHRTLLLYVAVAAGVHSASSVQLDVLCVASSSSTRCSSGMWTSLDIFRRLWLLHYSR